MTPRLRTQCQVEALVLGHDAPVVSGQWSSDQYTKTETQEKVASGRCRVSGHCPLTTD